VEKSAKKNPSKIFHLNFQNAKSTDRRMVFLGDLNLPYPVMVFVDVLIGLHLFALLFYFSKLFFEFSVNSTGKRQRNIQREE
jgi:hypothetical protein